MILLTQELSQLLLNAAKHAIHNGSLPSLELPANAPLTPTKNPEWGDFSSALAMQIAKQAKRNPLEVANLLANALPASPLVGKVSVSAPGFLNISIAREWLASQVLLILENGESFANSNLGKSAKAQVEFVSANPTGPLTVGRGRGAVVGDTFASILSAVGYDVTREYYFNNAGAQMRALGESLQLRYLQALGDAVELTDKHYRGDYLINLGREIATEYGESLRLAEISRFSKLAENAMFISIRHTLKRMNVHHDVFFNENSLYEDGSVWRVLEELKKRGYTYEQDGATWFKATEFGAEKDPVLVRSNGEPTYRLPDFAYHENKLQRGFSLIINVLGADHKDEFPDVKRGVQALGYNADGIQLLMNQFVSVKGQRMSTRAGRFTTLDELMDEVGADVVRFFMLVRDSSSHLEFDLDLALEQSEKNPVYYVQYAHARIASILRKAEGTDYTSAAFDPALLTHPAESALLLKLLELPELLLMCARELAPHHLTYYARDLASAFHTFYRDCRVLDPEQPALSSTRQKLVEAARIGLARALQLCGVSAPDSM